MLALVRPRFEKVVPSTNGLLSTVGFKLGEQACVYALEGSIAYAGSTVQWLRDNLEVGKWDDIGAKMSIRSNLRDCCKGS